MTLTLLQRQVLNSIIDGLYAEPCHSEVTAESISKNTGISTKSIRGVIASLIKRGIINVQIEDKQSYVHLNMEYWHLHPNWSKEIFVNN